VFDDKRWRWFDTDDIYRLVSGKRGCRLSTCSRDESEKIKDDVPHWGGWHWSLLYGTGYRIAGGQDSRANRLSLAVAIALQRFQGSMCLCNCIAVDTLLVVSQLATVLGVSRRQ